MQSTMNAVYLLWHPAKPYLYGRLNPVNHHWIEHFWIGSAFFPQPPRLLHRLSRVHLAGCSFVPSPSIAAPFALVPVYICTYTSRSPFPCSRLASLLAGSYFFTPSLYPNPNHPPHLHLYLYHTTLASILHCLPSSRLSSPFPSTPPNLYSPRSFSFFLPARSPPGPSSGRVAFAQSYYSTNLRSTSLHFVLPYFTSLCLTLLSLPSFFSTLPSPFVFLPSRLTPPLSALPALAAACIKQPPSSRLPALSLLFV